MIKKKSKSEPSEQEELIDGQPSGVELEPEDALLEISRPFDPEKIKVTKATRTIQLLVERIKHNEIDLEPDFQRRARIWDKQRKSRLIESLLLKIPLPAFYVASDSKENWSVVDGLQRLTTISDFCNGEFELEGLEYLTTLQEDTIHSLPRNMSRRIFETELNFNVIEPGTPEEVMFNIFKRINTGGIPLNGQEIRNALNKGPVRKFLEDLRDLEAFQKATDSSINDNRMAARECALRFCAFWFKPWEEYEGSDLDGFLNGAMRKINELSPQGRAKLKKEFERAMNAAEAIFGKDAFRKRYDLKSARKPISKPLFEAWSINLANRTDQELETLAEYKNELISHYLDHMQNNREFEVSISYATGGSQKVHTRFSTINEIIELVLLIA